MSSIISLSQSEKQTTSRYAHLHAVKSTSSRKHKTYRTNKTRKTKLHRHRRLRHSVDTESELSDNTFDDDETEVADDCQSPRVNAVGISSNDAARERVDSQEAPGRPPGRPSESVEASNNAALTNWKYSGAAYYSTLFTFLSTYMGCETHLASARDRRGFTYAAALRQEAANMRELDAIISQLATRQSNSHGL